MNVIKYINSLGKSTQKNVTVIADSAVVKIMTPNIYWAFSMCANIFSTSVSSRGYFYPHFIAKETKTQRD